MSKKFKSTHLAILLAAVIGCGAISAIPAWAHQENTTSQNVNEVEGIVENNELYLNIYFGITDVPEVVSSQFLQDALTKVSDFTFEKTNEQTPISFLESVKLAVKAAHFEELALTYKEEKWLDRHIEKEIGAPDAQYLACAIDTGLISQSQIKDAGRLITKEETVNLLMKVAEANGKARNFLGYTNETDIYAKLHQAMQEAVLFENEKLETIGEQAVMNKVTTGYNLLSNKYSSNFLPELTLRYGHSTEHHATQLIGLLNSEGIVAKVQLEPKTSIFEYLPEWGDVPPATPNYRVEVINENLMLAYSLEYDLVFEFETVEDKVRFNELVEAYAKKSDLNPEGEGMLFASWWQPLYISSVEMPEGYQEIYNNIIVDGNESLHPFCLAEDKEEVLEGLKAIDETVEVNQVKIWCNDAFYRYLSGESHE